MVAEHWLERGGRKRELGVGVGEHEGPRGNIQGGGGPVASSFVVLLFLSDGE